MKKMAAKGNAAQCGSSQGDGGEHAADLLPVVARLQGEGVSSLLGIAAKLNERGISAPGGAPPGKL
jgi:hypothetical protein